MGCIRDYCVYAYSFCWIPMLGSYGMPTGCLRDAYRMIVGLLLSVCCIPMACLWIPTGLLSDAYGMPTGLL